MHGHGAEARAERTFRQDEAEVPGGLVQQLLTADALVNRCLDVTRPVQCGQSREDRSGVVGRLQQAGDEAGLQRTQAPGTAVEQPPDALAGRETRPQLPSPGGVVDAQATEVLDQAVAHGGRHPGRIRPGAYVVGRCRLPAVLQA